MFKIQQSYDQYDNQGEFDWFNFYWFEIYSEQLWADCVYQYGGTGYDYLSDGGGGHQGIDCSHLVWRIYEQQGLDYTYYNCAYFTNTNYNRWFTQTFNPQPGDVVVWSSGHMGIYIDENTVWSTGNETGVGRKQQSLFGGTKTYWRWSFTPD